MSKHKEMFRDFGDGSFRAVEWWIVEKGGIENYAQALTVMDWDDVCQVQAWPTWTPVPDNLLPDGPRCIIVWCGKEMKLRASFVDVAKARAEWRRRSQFRTVIGTN